MHAYYIAAVAKRFGRRSVCTIPTIDVAVVGAFAQAGFSHQVSVLYVRPHSGDEDTAAGCQLRQGG